MRSRGVATLLAGVVIAAATPRDLGSAVHDMPACRGWKREYQTACVVPLVKLGRRGDASAYDARRHLCEGCHAILAHASRVCPAEDPAREPHGCPRLAAGR
jgi:hypothetical protein